MVDNTELSSGSGGDTIATDDISGVKYPRSKIVIGADGTNDGDVASANPLPIGANTVKDGSGTVYAPLVDADGHLQVDVLACASHAVTNAGTFAVQVDGAALTALQLIDDAVAAEGDALGKGVLLQGDDGTDRTNVLVDTDGHVQVDVLASALPTGAATAALQTTGNTSLSTIAGDTTSLDGKVTACNTGAVVISSGTVTANLGATDNAVLDTIATNTTGLNGCVGGSELQVDVVGALPAGTNAIGKLAANSGVDIGDVDVTSIAAGTNTIGGVIAANQTDSAYDGTTSCTIKRKSGLAASGTTAILAAVAGKKFRILAFAAFATSATATNIYLATTTDTDVLGDSSNPIPVAVDADGDNVAGFVLPWNPGGWTETSTANEALNLVLSAAQDVIYAITYIEVD